MQKKKSSEKKLLEKIGVYKISGSKKTTSYNKTVLFNARKKTTAYNKTVRLNDNKKKTMFINKFATKILLKTVRKKSLFI